MQKINLDQANHTVISKQLLHSVSLSAVSWVNFVHWQAGVEQLMLWRDHVGEFGLFFSMEMTKDVFGTMKPLLQINSTWLWCYNIVTCQPPFTFYVQLMHLLADV